MKTAAHQKKKTRLSSIQSTTYLGNWRDKSHFSNHYKTGLNSIETIIITYTFVICPLYCKFCKCYVKFP